MVDLPYPNYWEIVDTLPDGVTVTIGQKDVILTPTPGDAPEWAPSTIPAELVELD